MHIGMLQQTVLADGLYELAFSQPHSHDPHKEDTLTLDQEFVNRRHCR